MRAMSHMEDQPQENLPPVTCSSNQPSKYIRIIEEPNYHRFRYHSEGRTAGLMSGVSSTPEHKTYPAIEIVGCTGTVSVVVSCVSKDKPYLPHPHHLVGKNCKKGIYLEHIKTKGGTVRIVFDNIAIRCMKRKEFTQALETRRSLNVDPFMSKFVHIKQTKQMDSNVVRLAFQVIEMRGPDKKKDRTALKAIVSKPIFGTEPKICRLCRCSARVEGGDEIIILCEKIEYTDLEVVFYEEENGNVIWENYGEFNKHDIHKQTAIVAKAPCYRKANVSDNAKIYVKLRRLPDNKESEPREFHYRNNPDDIKKLRNALSAIDPITRQLQIQQELSDLNRSSAQSKNEEIRNEYPPAPVANMTPSSNSHCQFCNNTNTARPIASSFAVYNNPFQDNEFAGNGQILQNHHISYPVIRQQQQPACQQRTFNNLTGNQVLPTQQHAQQQPQFNDQTMQGALPSFEQISPRAQQQHHYYRQQQLMIHPQQQTQQQTTQQNMQQNGYYNVQTLNINNMLIVACQHQTQQ